MFFINIIINNFILKKKKKFFKNFFFFFKIKLLNNFILKKIYNFNHIKNNLIKFNYVYFNYYVIFFFEKFFKVNFFFKINFNSINNIFSILTYNSKIKIYNKNSKLLFNIFILCFLKKNLFLLSYFLKNNLIKINFFLKFFNLSVYKLLISFLNLFNCTGLFIIITGKFNKINGKKKRKKFIIGKLKFSSKNTKLAYNSNDILSLHGIFNIKLFLSFI